MAAVAAGLEDVRLPGGGRRARQVLQGIDPCSVLFETEWPEIKGLIAKGKVIFEELEKKG